MGNWYLLVSLDCDEYLGSYFVFALSCLITAS